MVSVVDNPESDLTAMVVVSPMASDGEAKNQDRAVWYPSLAVAALADGLTSSAFSQYAAEFAVKWSPTLFQGKMKERIAAISDQLLLQRHLRKNQGVNCPDRLPRTMQLRMLKVGRDKLQSSYQTTLIAIKLQPAGKNITADILCCGDSACLVYTASGHLLFSSLHSDRPEPGSATRIVTPFGPGDVIPVKPVAKLANFPSLLRRLNIHPSSAGGWLLCRVSNYAYPGSPKATGHNHTILPDNSLCLADNDLLAVPRHLLGSLKTPGHSHRHLLLSFGPAIRLLPYRYLRRMAGPFPPARQSTAALPDNSQYRHIPALFPPGSHYILCSDGFYGCFTDPAELWDWLHRYRRLYHDRAGQKEFISQLHQRLQMQAGDDDISFIWIYPRRDCPGRPAGPGQH